MLVYIVFVICLSIDTFIAALIYEASNIRISFKSNLILSFFGSFSLFISLLMGNVLGNIINIEVLKWLSFFILFFIGLTKIFNNGVREMLTNLNFSKQKSVITIYSDYKKADFDDSKTLQPNEALYLAMALSLDNIISGVSFNINFNLIIIIFSFSLFINVLAVWMTKLIRNVKYDLSFVGGVIFIIIAFFKLKH